MSVLDAPVSRAAASIAPDAAAPASATAPASTAAPPPPGRAGRIIGWVIVIALLLGIALLSMRFIVTNPDLSGTLNPESPGPNGAKALAQLTRDQGVDVEVTRSRAEATDALGSDATLVLTDPFTLSDAAVHELVDRADRVVLLSSSARMLRLLDLGEDAPAEGGTVRAQCTVPEFARVGEIDAARMFSPPKACRAASGRAPARQRCCAALRRAAQSVWSRAPGCSPTPSWRRTATPLSVSRCSLSSPASSGTCPPSPTATSRPTTSRLWAT
ncbi:DUF4350 domain-containing protein [Microbacterium suwonense]|uniref:DUF4350 domain-containing protein n=1 Tax=Microbacterium suwonense TaxID=683047 RepID=A0ABM8FSU7_9MICO|nr:DUF4350 domain-containing protein [Microbacterium suwonense]BDZ38749.1 hypothetical protein GCM10025863_13630 [Microbacterium suwonense]